MKIMFVSGLGFFTDAYDLFVIGIVVARIYGYEVLSWPSGPSPPRYRRTYTLC